MATKAQLDLARKRLYLRKDILDSQDKRKALLLRIKQRQAELRSLSGRRRRL